MLPQLRVRGYLPAKPGLVPTCDGGSPNFAGAYGGLAAPIPIALPKAFGNVKTSKESFFC